jgi:hypothetical protein
VPWPGHSRVSHRITVHNDILHSPYGHLGSLGDGGKRRNYALVYSVQGRVLLCLCSDDYDWYPPGPWAGAGFISFADESSDSQQCTSRLVNMRYVTALPWLMDERSKAATVGQGSVQNQAIPPREKTKALGALATTHTRTYSVHTHTHTSIFPRFRCHPKTASVDRILACSPLDSHPSPPSPLVPPYTCSACLSRMP